MKIKTLKNRKHIIQKPMKLSTISNVIFLSLSLLLLILIVVYLKYYIDQKQSEDKNQIIQVNYKDSESRQIIRTIQRTSKPQYTQGLAFLNETTLIESSGLYGPSSIHTMNINDINNFTNFQPLSNEYFGEGCDIINNKIYQLTWRNKKIFIWDLETLKPLGQIQLDKQVSEGWGLTHRILENGEIQVLITDGSHNVYIADENFNVQNKIPIKYQDQRLTTNINELEYVNGTLYANIYLSTIIVAIDLDKGEVIKVYEFADLKKMVNPNERGDCLNGIAYNKFTGNFWITGKFWPYFWEIKLN